MKYRVRINPVALSDVQEIKEYIAEDKSGAALKMVAEIYSKIESLADFPERGTSLSGKINIKTDYRFVICDSYLIFYKIEGKYVSVYRILNGARDYMSILFSDDMQID
jgi:toxin ParE1/3/4